MQGSDIIFVSDRDGDGDQLYLGKYGENKLSPVYIRMILIQKLNIWWMILKACTFCLMVF